MAVLRLWLVHRLWGQYSIHPRYNRIVRPIFPLLLILCLAGCQHGGSNNPDAVRQGVMDRLAQQKFDLNAMDIKVSSVEFHGEQADAVVSVALKGKTDGMSFHYHLQRQANKWVVVGSPNSNAHGGAGTADPNMGGANPHGGAMPPAAAGGDNPHGGMAPAGGAGSMPSPQDLPPAKKK